MAKIKCIRSGGQTGADRAAMDVAKHFRVRICGWCPQGGWAEDYPDPPGLLADYPELQETPSRDTAQRTRWNMRDADAILTIMPSDSKESKGTQIGVQEGFHLEKPMFMASGVEDSPEIIAWLNALPEELDLAVGGPRASECPNVYDVTEKILSEVLGEVHEKYL